MGGEIGRRTREGFQLIPNAVLAVRVSADKTQVYFGEKKSGERVLMAAESVYLPIYCSSGTCGHKTPVYVCVNISWHFSNSSEFILFI